MNEVHAEEFEAIETPIGPLEQFRFQRLSSTTCIRLIKIHTELVRGDISCTMQQYESDSVACPTYVALSYVWGDSTARHTVYINGLVCRVHHSLWQFLDRARTDEALACERFWTDLLCIDQIHHSEKNEQVSRMGDIYAKAKYVISWLGEHTATMEALRTFIQFSKKDGTQLPLKYSWKAPESRQIHKACDQLAFEEPYWKRVWVMQEVACAKACIVACGDVSLSFDDLLQKMENAMERSIRFDYSSDRDRIMRRIRGLANIRTGILEGRSMSTLDLIHRTSFCQATRDQDRIYGLLGLARRFDPGFDYRALGISYDKSLNDIWWDIVFMVLDEKSEVSTKSDLAALNKRVPVLTPPRKHLELDGITSIRRTQAETACQVSEAVYSTSVQAFLGILISDTDKVGLDLRSQGTTRDMLRNGWDHAVTHISDPKKDLPCLQSRIGRSALAALQFTSWHPPAKSPLVAHLPSGWFCAAHSPYRLRNTTSKHRIIPSQIIYGIKTEINSHPFRCSGATRRAPRCDLSIVVLKLVQLGITCLARTRFSELRLPGGRTDIEFYCDCCALTSSVDK